LAGTGPDADRVKYVKTVRQGPYDPQGLDGPDRMNGPTQEDYLRQQGLLGGPAGEGQWDPSQEGQWGPDGQHYQKTVTTTQTQYKTEKDGVVETRIERKMVITSDGEDIDHDAALAEAIRSVTEMNPDLSVEKIEIKTESETTA